MTRTGPQRPGIFNWKQYAMHVASQQYCWVSFGRQMDTLFAKWTPCFIYDAHKSIVS